MKTPGLLWLYLVLGFGCLVLLSIMIRANFQFINSVENYCTSKKDSKEQQSLRSSRAPRFKTTKVWGYIGIGALITLLILIFVALATEVNDIPCTKNSTK